MLALGQAALNCNGAVSNEGTAAELFTVAGVCYGSYVDSGDTVLQSSTKYYCKNGKYWSAIYLNSARCSGDNVAYETNMESDTNTQVTCDQEPCQYFHITSKANLPLGCDTYTASMGDSWSDAYYIQDECASAYGSSFYTTCSEGTALQNVYSSSGCLGSKTSTWSYPLGNDQCMRIDSEMSNAVFGDFICGTAAVGGPNSADMVSVSFFSFLSVICCSYLFLI
eukprot:CAMPEP_0202690420 /NCGR_PEP_ID=MMETSP1385-20130828/5410_1 /ASSEMBLY_ACC=CAM_ASM_000861 /TAXON_ID=933848 /ORGANISM="Elphidium margaritaceum" /LENGTH=223 /DNA_ID=CAMNT_0049345683 /DNA_START=127 /DNA_END=798 /DNA_ORIENTATION=+